MSVVACGCSRALASIKGEQKKDTRLSAYVQIEKKGVEDKGVYIDVNDRSPNTKKGRYMRPYLRFGGSPCWTRTNDLAVNSRSLLPTELRRNIFSFFVCRSALAARYFRTARRYALFALSENLCFPRARLWAISTHRVETSRRRPD